MTTSSESQEIAVITQEFFLACAMMPEAHVGKARYLVKVTAPQLRAEL